MEIRQIRLFIAAAEEESFSKAAKRENIVQSGVSMALRSLEDEFGTELFIRNTRKVALSDSGKQFLPAAYEILNSIQKAKTIISSIENKTDEIISIGTETLITHCLDLPKIISKFTEKNPQFRINLLDGNFLSSERSLKAHSIDLSFISTSPRTAKYRKLLQLEATPFVVMVPGHHQLATSEKNLIDIKKLSQDVFIDFPKGWSIREHVDAIFRKEGIHRRVEFEVSCLELLSKLVTNNLGIAILPKKLADKYQLNQKMLTSCNQILPLWIFSLYSSRTGLELAPIERAFIEFLKKYLEENS
ncbi:LysR family transcriptional regulator (plasmid) [Advenella kashmirensis WT001]|uniref:LysR family transcriptional regulator n=1 Tax=Advenella kashmirensis (strain DSM 17095 / LMG 22695 / WT001) TaxID=1036672 RepID=I3UI31_ADVKW|nr:LysR family transcriptional regulator [Advenella kashmirensis]AFK64669.1 LysR family transcriptional regulator [Advenella kashmirensis WT001]